MRTGSTGPHLRLNSKWVLARRHPLLAFFGIFVVSCNLLRLKPTFYLSLSQLVKFPKDLLDLSPYSFDFSEALIDSALGEPVANNVVKSDVQKLL